jgi:RNA polymerase sigma factor (sigma-70 family)
MRKENIASIYNRYVDDLYTYALYLGFEKGIIMDAIHDVFCKFAADEKLLQDVSNIKFYLFKSLKNRLYDIYKARKEYAELSAIDLQDAPFNIQVTIEDRLIDKEEQQQIKDQLSEMLDSLTERQREVVYLRYVQEYDYAQISELLNISIHGCRKLLSKAMQNLREKYGALVFLFLFS